MTAPTSIPLDLEVVSEGAYGDQLARYLSDATDINGADIAAMLDLQSVDPGHLTRAVRKALSGPSLADLLRGAVQEAKDAIARDEEANRQALEEYPGLPTVTGTIIYELWVNDNAVEAGRRAITVPPRIVAEDYEEVNAVANGAEVGDNLAQRMGVVDDWSGPFTLELDWSEGLEEFAAQQNDTF